MYLYGGHCVCIAVLHTDVAMCHHVLVQSRIQSGVLCVAVQSVQQPRVARFFLVQNTKTGKYIPNYHELYQMSLKYNKRP
jgi:hypothetical protein